MAYFQVRAVSFREGTGISKSLFFSHTVNCWFGLGVWNPRIPLWKWLLLRGTLRIANHRAPNRQLTISWLPNRLRQARSVWRWDSPCVRRMWVTQKIGSVDNALWCHYRTESGYLLLGVGCRMVPAMEWCKLEFKDGFGWNRCTTIAFWIFDYLILHSVIYCCYYFEMAPSQ